MASSLASAWPYHGFDILEFFPIVGALWLWSTLWANSVAWVRCDNLVVVHIINNLTARLERIMRLVQAFTLRALRFNIVVKAEHIPGLVIALLII